MSIHRREKIIQILSGSSGAISGSELAKGLGVSRQVIVQDVAILRAKGYDVMATPQGYLLPDRAAVSKTAVLAVRHNPWETRDELNILVDHGLKVLDVLVEHPLYGELRGYLMLESRLDVKRFVERVEEESASLLSSLTNGVHLHTVEYRNREDLEGARRALQEMGFSAGD
jgi:hypothetical protein